MSLLIISGGQTGADQAGWRAARKCGLRTGGWMPKGFLTEDGPRPEFADIYGAKEHSSPKYPPRTLANVRWFDLTLVFDVSRSDQFDDLSRGSQLTLRAAMNNEVTNIVVVVDLGVRPGPRRPASIADKIKKNSWATINVAGNRESKSPGIGVWAEEYMTILFGLLKDNNA